MNHLTLTVPVANGRCQFTEPQLNAIRAFVGRFNDKAVSVTWKRPASTRSLKANAYYWGVFLTTVANETGNTTEDLHLVLKEMMLPRKFITLGGKQLEVKKSTADLEPKEFGEYLEKCIAWAAQELSISIAPPN